MTTTHTVTVKPITGKKNKQMNNIATHRKRLGERLFALALDPGWTSTAIKAKSELIKSSRGRRKVDGRAGLRHKLSVIDEAANLIANRRKIARRAPGRYHNRISAVHSTIQDRLDELRLSTARRAINQHYRTGDQLIVRFGDRVTISREEELDWSFYAKSCKYPKNYVSTTVTVPRDWRTQTRETGDLGGLLSLSAEPVAGHPGVFRAVWLEQGRGSLVSTQQGYIAVQDRIAYHLPWCDGHDSTESAIVERARKGLRRKLQRLGVAEPSWIKRFANATFPVSVEDATQSGACLTGVRQWCSRVGIDIEREAVPASEIIAGYRLCPMREVHAAIIHASRSQS